MGVAGPSGNIFDEAVSLEDGLEYSVVEDPLTQNGAHLPSLLRENATSKLQKSHKRSPMTA